MSAARAGGQGGLEEGGGTPEVRRFEHRRLPAAASSRAPPVPSIAVAAAACGSGRRPAGSALGADAVGDTLAALYYCGLECIRG